MQIRVLQSSAECRVGGASAAGASAAWFRGSVVGGVADGATWMGHAGTSAGGASTRRRAAAAAAAAAAVAAAALALGALQLGGHGACGA